MKPIRRLPPAACLLCLLAALALAREPDSGSEPAPRSAKEVGERLERTQEEMSRSMEELTTLLQRLQVMKDSYFKADDPRSLASERERLNADIRARLDGLGSSRKNLASMCQVYNGLVVAQAGSTLGFKSAGELLHGTGRSSARAAVDAASGLLAAGRCRIFQGDVRVLESKAEAAAFSEQAAFHAAARSFEERRRRRMLLLLGAVALAAGAAAWRLARDSS
jgi:hypothetical protein